jgi:hypothetical protein
MPISTFEVETGNQPIFLPSWDATSKLSSELSPTKVMLTLSSASERMYVSGCGMEWGGAGVQGAGKREP